MENKTEFFEALDKKYGGLLENLEDSPLTWEWIDQLKAQGVKVLILTLKREWFDYIKSGFKKEEYREIKPYYNSRLMKQGTTDFKEFDIVVFTNGYGRRVPYIALEFKGMRFDKGKEKWGAVADTVYYVIELGKKIYCTN